MKGHRDKPIFLEGKRAGPPEDCGGAWGYADLLKIIQTPDRKEYKDMMTWLGSEFDPEAFNLNMMNAKLHKMRK